MFLDHACCRQSAATTTVANATGAAAKRKDNAHCVAVHCPTGEIEGFLPRVQPEQSAINGADGDADVVKFPPVMVSCMEALERENYHPSNQ